MATPIKIEPPGVRVDLNRDPVLGNAASTVSVSISYPNHLSEEWTRWGASRLAETSGCGN